LNIHREIRDLTAERNHWKRYTVLSERDMAAELISLRQRLTGVRQVLAVVLSELKALREKHE